MKKYYQKLIISLVCIIIFTSQGVVMAQEINDADNNTLTVEQAIEIATKNSIDLKNAYYELEQAKESRKQAGEEIQYFRPSGIGGGYEDLAQRSALKLYRSSEINLEMKKKMVDFKKEKISIDVRNAFDDIIKTQKSIELTKKIIDNERNNLNNAILRQKYGFLSKRDLETIQNSFKQLEKQKINLEISLSQAFNNFNLLLGITESQKYSLEKETIFEPLESFDLEAHIKKILQDDFYIWNQQQVITLAELDVSLYTYNANQEPYRNKELALYQEKNKLATLKLNLENSIRERYNQIVQLENQYLITRSKIEDVQKNIGVLQIQYELGMVTQSLVRNEEIQLLKLENELDELAIQHQQLKIYLMYPHLLPNYTSI